MTAILGLMRAGWKLGSGILADTNRMHADLIAAGVAFYALFAVFPGLAAVIALIGLAADPAVIDSQLDLLADIAPPQVMDIFHSQIDRLVSTESTTLGWTTLVSFVIALWSARLGVAALIRGLNAVFGENQRGGLRHLGTALLLTLLLITMAVVALLAVVVAPLVLAVLPLGQSAAMALTAIRWAAALAVMVLGLGLLYRYGPNRRGRRLGWITPGALLVTVLWLGASALLSAYVSGFGHYNEVYGSIGAVIILLLWFYVSAYLVLLGGALNRAIYDKSAD